MRRFGEGYDGVSAAFRWTSTQLDAFASRPHIDGANTPETQAVVIAFGDYEGGEFLGWENRWNAGNFGAALFDTCSYGADVQNRAFQFNPFLPHAIAPCRGDRRSVVVYHIGSESMADTPARALMRALGFALQDEPPPQDERIAMPGMSPRPPDEVHQMLGRSADLAPDPASTTVASAVAEFCRLRSGVDGVADTSRSSEKYRRVAFALARCRAPGTPGHEAEILPQDKGVMAVARSAYVRFIVMHHPERGAPWAPVPLG